MNYIPADSVKGTPASVQAVYGTGDKAIIINIALNETELADWKEHNNVTSTNPEFFYNKVLEAGTTTDNPLIESVQLDKTVGNNAFVKMDYNLTVTVESAQVVDDKDRQIDTANAVIAVPDTWGASSATFNANDTTVKSDDTVTWSFE